MKAKSTREVVKRLNQEGWHKVRQNGTSHAIFKKDGRSVPVKLGRKEIPARTLCQISKETGIKF